MSIAINIIFVYMFIAVPAWLIRKLFDYIAEEIITRIKIEIIEELNKEQGC